MAKDKLKEIKNRMNITHDYQDNQLKGFIEDVKEDLLDSGVKQAVIDSDKSIGCIARGVSEKVYGQFDLKGDYSDYFKQRAIQLSKVTDEEIKLLLEKENANV